MKTKHHEVELTGLQEWLSTEEVVYASSTRERKRLSASLNGGLKVTVNGVVKWQGMQAFSAVEAYNSITEEFKQ